MTAHPHAVTVTVFPRQMVVPFAREWEAEYELDIEHPATCPETVEACPVTEYLETIGVDERLLDGFPDPETLTDEELAALDGTVRYVTMSRTYSGDAWEGYL